MAVPVQVDLNPNTKKVDAELARIRAAAKGVDFGGGARSIEKLSRPLGKITGQATEFQKSLEASNARVLAFGASVAVINKLSDAFGALVSNTIKVEATFAKIGVILGGTQKDLQEFGRGIFDVAKSTATSFDQVAEGALELARQGLSTEESLSRVETALKLVRVAGIDSQKAVAGLTAAIKGFEGAGLTVGDIADKLAEVDTKFAVSTEDLINGLERASASARVAGVSFDELLGVVTTVQERTQRGGAVIGNAFKTIFARLGRSDTLVALEEIGIKTLDASGNVRSAIPLFQELAVKLNELGLKSVEAGDIIQKVAGVRQRDILISLVEDLTSGQSQFAKSLQVSSQAAGALDQKNQALNQTLEALISKTVTSGQQLASVLGEIGFADSAKDILKGLSSVLGGITKFLDGDSIGSKFAQGLISGIGSILTGPGLALIGAIFLKLFVDLSKFGVSSLKSLLGLNKASQQQQALQQSVLQTLLQNESVQASILRLEGDKVSQEQLLLKIYNEQAAALARVQKIAANVTPGLFSAGLRGGERGVAPTGKASGGYIAAEARDVSRGVGGAPASSKVVSIPNFAFGGGKRGTMVANTSEYIVPNFAGGGDAIFNRDMVRSMGLPAGARKINAAGGYVPNFARRASKIPSAPKGFAAFMQSKGLTPMKLPDEIRSSNYDRAYAKGKYREEYDSLSEREKRNIVKRAEQETQLNKSVGQDGIPDFGILYSDAVGNAKAVNIPNNKDLIKAIPVNTEPPNKLYEDVRDTMVKSAIDFASTLGFVPDIINDPKFARIADQNLNPGSVESAFGTVFEAAFQGALGIDQKSNATFDLPNEAAIKQLIKRGKENGVIKGLGGSLQGLLAVDIKNALNKDNLNSVSNKIKNYKTDLFKKKEASASGYIPNFAAGNYVFDSDRLDRKTANAILKTILGTKKKKDLLIAPAGTGKSTAAAKIGKFIASPNDVQKAESFTILSGAARAKNSLMSAGLSSIIDAVNSSGGRVSYLYAKNMDVLSRRFGRVSQGSDDLRTTKQLRGTIKAPLNQFDFIKGVKSTSRRFSIMRGAEGFMPELGDAISREVGAGVPLNQVRINQSGKLRNAQNPMGLAVTNTRDEPTGRIPSDSAARGFIPNFAKGEASKSLDKAAKSAENFSSATDGALGKILLLQTISFGLSGTFSTLGGETDGFGKRLAEAANATSSFITTLITLQAAGLVGGDSSKAITNVLGKLLGGGKGLGQAVSRGGRLGRAASTGNLSSQNVKNLTGTLTKGFGPLAKTVFNVSKLFGRFVPFIGPVILGFQVLSGLSKVLTGAGLIENFKNLAGLNKKSAEAIQEEIEKRRQLAQSFAEGKDRPTLISDEQTQKALLDELSVKVREQAEKVQISEAGLRTSGVGVAGSTKAGENKKQFDEDKKQLAELEKEYEDTFNRLVSVRAKLTSQTIGAGESLDFKSFKSLKQLVDDVKSNLQAGLIAQKDTQLTTELANNFAIAKAEINGVSSVLKDINDFQAIQNDLQNANTEAINNSKTSILDSVKGIEEYKGIEEGIGEEFEKRISKAKNAKEIQEALKYLAEQQQGLGYSLNAIFEDQNGELQTQLNLNKANADEAERRKKAELEIALLRAKDKGEKLTRDAGLAQFARTGGEGGFAASPERVAANKAYLDQIEAEKKLKESINDISNAGDEATSRLAIQNYNNAKLELDIAKQRTTEAAGALQISQTSLSNEIQRAKVAAERTKSDNETLRSLESQLASSDQLTSREITALELQKERVENTRSQFDINQKILEITEKINNAGKIGSNLTENDVQRLQQEKQELQAQLEELKEILQLKEDIAKVEMFKTFGDGLKAGTASIRNDIDNFQYKLGEQIPLSFADNMGQAMKDAVSGAKDLDDALSSAAENFLGMIRDAFLQQAANQFTNTLFGGGPTAVFGGPGNGGQKNIFSSIGGLFGGGSSVANGEPIAGSAESVFKPIVGGDGQASPAQQASGGGFFSKIGGFFGDLFGGGKKGGGTPGSSPTNPLFVSDVANGVMGGGAASGAEKALEGITGEDGESAGEGLFSKLKSGFGDLFGGLKDKLGGIFGGLKESLGGLFGGGAGGGGLGGIFSNLLGGGGLGGIFKNLLGSLFGGFGGFGGFFGFNKGGMVPTIRGYANGGSVGSTDTVPAMLTPGEFVVKKSAVDKYGTDFLSSLNRGILPMQGFQNGGSVSPVSSEAGSSGIGGNQINNTSDFTFNIQDGKVSQEGGQASSENQREFAARIRSAVTTVIQEESRTGGSLNYLYKK